MNTKLIYLEEMELLECVAKVVGLETVDGKTVVSLDQTIFYPQGGGQPYDKGTITNGEKVFIVNEVRFVDGVVRHIGSFAGEVFVSEEDVVCRVDKDRRALNSRLHSAGHLIDMALRRLGIGWVANKGYHFPDGPYVEYTGNLDGLNVEELRTNLEVKCNSLIAEGLVVEARLVSRDEMQSLCSYVPPYILADKPARVVLFGDFSIPCGGTHVTNLSEIGRMTIRKLKKKGEGVIVVAYEVSGR